MFFVLLYLYIDSLFNGFKIIIVLEEFGIFYMLYYVCIVEGEYCYFDYLVLYLYGCIFVLVDEVVGIIVFEFVVILLYLVE